MIPIAYFFANNLVEYLGLYTVNISLWIATADWSAVITPFKEHYLVVFIAANILPRQRKSTSVSRSWLLPQLDCTRASDDASPTSSPYSEQTEITFRTALVLYLQKLSTGRLPELQRLLAGLFSAMVFVCRYIFNQSALG